jgi:hypothetical protein
MNVECAQPLREGASSSGVNVFPNVEHSSIITYTLVSTGECAREGHQADPDQARAAGFSSAARNVQATPG